MTASKRVFDLVVAILLSVLLLPLIVLTALAILMLDGGPIFYISERMKTATQGFRLVKFRTMKPTAIDSGVSGGDKVVRITRTGAFLRRTRLDEVPQLWNVVKGDISFVGPRPPLAPVCRTVSRDLWPGASVASGDNRPRFRLLPRP